MVRIHTVTGSIHTYDKPTYSWERTPHTFVVRANGSNWSRVFQLINVVSIDNE